MVFYELIRRFSTSTLRSLKFNFPSRKSAESAIENSGKSISDHQKLPRSYRALLKMDPKERFMKERRQLGIGAYALLAIPITTFGLGCWQVQRRRQKLERIKMMQENSNKEPGQLPSDLRELANMELTPIKVLGEFCHDEELIIKPRHRHDVYKLAGQMTDAFHRMNEVGAYVITPFQPVDRPYKILVQRGWVPLSHIDPATRQAGQVKGQVEMVGIVRGNEKKPKFVPENDPLAGEWHYRDVDMMARMRNCAPVYVEATSDTTIRGGPIGGQTLVTLRNEHLSYIVTWFTLSVATGWLWYRRYFKYKSLV